MNASPARRSLPPKNAALSDSKSVIAVTNGDSDVVTISDHGDDSTERARLTRFAHTTSLRTPLGTVTRCCRPDLSVMVSWKSWLSTSHLSYQTQSSKRSPLALPLGPGVRYL